MKLLSGADTNKNCVFLGPFQLFFALALADKIREHGDDAKCTFVARAYSLDPRHIPSISRLL